MLYAWISANEDNISDKYIQKKWVYPKQALYWP